MYEKGQEFYYKLSNGNYRRCYLNSYENGILHLTNTLGKEFTVNEKYVGKSIWKSVAGKTPTQKTKKPEKYIINNCDFNKTKDYRRSKQAIRKGVASAYPTKTVYSNSGLADKDGEGVMGKRRTPEFTLDKKKR